MNLKRISWLGWALPSAAVVLLLWLPFGFSLHGLIEEWDVLGTFTISGPVLFVTPHSFFEVHRLRPLTVFPHALGYLLDRDSFDAWHWIMMAMLVLKGAASSYLGTRITRSPRWGVCFGLLVLLYPADTMQLSFRGLHINAALAMVLLGAALLVYAQDRRPGVGRWLVVALGAASLVAAQLMYEVAFTLVLFPLLVLWCRDGFGLAWQKLRVQSLPTLGWIVAALLYAGYVVWASSKGGQSYQQSLTDGHSPVDILRAALPKLFQIGMLRAFVGGWFDAWGIAKTEFAGRAYLFAFGLVSSLLVLAWPRCEPQSTEAVRPAHDLSWAHLGRMVLAGLVLFVLGYGPYLFSGAHVLISQRTYLFAAPGAALVVLVLLIALSRAWRPLAGAAILGFMTLGAAAQLYQFQHYVQISEAQRKILRVIVENFDGEAGAKSLLILDGSNRLSHTWFLRDNLHLALTYLYDRPVNPPEICLMPSGERQQLDALGRAGRCIEEADRWVFQNAAAVPGVTASPQSAKAIAKSDLITLRIQADGSVVPDPALEAYRAQLATADTPSARRYRGILRPEVGGLHLGLFASPENADSYRWDFGRWWSLEEPTRGNGWREAEWKIGRLHHDASAWKTQKKSSLLFELSPKAAPYALSGTFTAIVSPSIKDSIQLRLNGMDVPIHWISELKFIATVPPHVLRKGTNTLEVNSATDRGYYDLSAQLSDFAIGPIR